MVQSTIFAMSLTGSILFLFWYFISKIEVISHSFKRNLLGITTISFLIPFPRLKNYYLDLLKYLFHYEKQGIKEVTEIKHILYITPDGSLYNFDIKHYVTILFFCSWIMVMIVMLIKKRTQYKKLNFVLQNSISKKMEEYQKNFIEQEKKYRKIKKDISVKKVYGVELPMTIGFLKPTIFLPVEEMTKKELELIIKHEMVHIQKKDFILKIMGTLVVMIHWFNPLSYILLKQINTISELSCDETVVLTLKNEEIKQYQKLILQFLIEFLNNEEEYENTSFLPISYFGNSTKKRVEERLKAMKKIRKMTKLQIVVTTGVWIVMMMVSSVGILAYQEERVTHVEKYDPKREITTYVYPDDVSPLEDPSLPQFTLVEGCDNYIMYEDGTTEPMYENETIERASCSHNYRSTKYSNHQKDGNGGCTVTIYTAEICSKCGAERNREEQNSISYKKCPH
ncbi:M56 family metallopeptidase [Clostridium sp. MD294]|uniref:M56 family metallopeptidase n=1 Tax=Clostridium sp. MD294 TaxID=97138 RepID=UPI0002CBCBAC|nr:M56 family metallopeptidase [Clostridium sp. MD294]USF31308.1 hypothetical protein C820_002754 [Clostridium sp. MD294]